MEPRVHVVLFLFGIVLVQSVCSKIEYISLNSSTDGWNLKNSNSSNGFIEVPGNVPGGVYSDLSKAGVIQDILYGDNDVNTRWVAYDNWTYSTTFEVTNQQVNKNRTQIVLYGVDTVAVILINNEEVDTTNNMFVRYVFDIKPYLKVGTNSINVTFTSPVLAADSRSDAHFTEPECVPNTYNGECHANQLRKMQASFSWDWGPAFPSMGLWKGVEIVFYDFYIMREVTAETYEKDEKMHMKVACYLEKLHKVNNVKVTMAVSVRLSGKKYTKEADIVITEETDDRAVPDFDVEFILHNYNLWWPNGYGETEASIADVECKVKTPDGAESVKSIHTAVRTVELVQEDLTNVFNKTSNYGNTFYFKVNGQPIFAKGSNWIPGHILPELGANEALVDSLLEAAKEANINMLRVWGGGVYESEYFYHKCDELGIMVWQDFMFACAMYPVDEQFIDSVKTEVLQNVLRLKHHPSIVLWAGNNENEAALVGNWYNTALEFTKYKEEYIKLYVDTIKAIVTQIDPLRNYAISSPSNGIATEEVGYVAMNPYDPHFGDTHYYNYINDNWNAQIYPKTRFASEYGFQSLPSLYTLRTATRRESDLELGSHFVTHRQHAPGGYEYMESQMEKHLKIDLGKKDSFEKFIFYSQITQAMAMKVESEYYRQSQADWFTMGALYWQLNDVWQAPSWSGIEYGGRWKMLHYYVKSFFAPVLVSPRLLETGDIDIYLLNDRPITLNNSNTKIQVDIFNWTSLRPIKTEYYSAEVNAFSAKKQDIGLNFWKEKNKSDIFLRFRLISDLVESSPDNIVFPVPLKKAVGLKDPKIQIAVSKAKKNNKEFTIDITVDNIVLFFWLETSFEGHFDDNGMTITERKIRRIFYSKHPIQSRQLEMRLKYKYYIH